MQFVAHETELRTPKFDRAALEVRARQGSAVAIKKLAGPRFPRALEYLYAWFHELSMARGEGTSGPAALTYLDVDAWARLTDRHPLPHEVQALFALDITYRVAMRPDDVMPAEAPSLRDLPAWPESKPKAVEHA